MEQLPFFVQTRPCCSLSSLVSCGLQLVSFDLTHFGSTSFLSHKRECVCSQDIASVNKSDYESISGFS